MAKQKEFKRIIIDGEKTNYEINRKGEVRNITTQHILSPFLSSTGYWRVNLRIHGKAKKFFVHRLLAMTFIKIPKRHLKNGLGFDDLVPNHKDGIKTHNTVSNLEWTTIQENTQHAFRTGLANTSIGENSHLAKMDEKTALKCCKLLAKGKTTTEIAEKLGVSKKSVQHIKSGECWRHISRKFEFPKLGKAIPNTMKEKDIHAICKLLEEKKYTDREIANKFSVSREYVRDIRNHKRRNNISVHYSF